MIGKLLKDPVYRKWSARNTAAVMRTGLKIGPLRLPRLMKRYPWISRMGKSNDLMARLMGNRRGAYREVTGYLVHQVVRTFNDLIQNLSRGEKPVVWHEDMVPAEIFRAMGLFPFMVEMLGIVLPLVDIKAGEVYLDEAENQGIPVETCTLPRMSLGLAMKGAFPDPQAVIASNSPCDGGMASYSYFEKLSDAPAFRLDLPYRFKDERALTYYAGELRRMIAFLEENTPGRMDWDRLREICQERNRAVEHRLELWDLLRTRPAPVGSDIVYLSNLVFYALQTGTPRGTQVFQKLTEYARKSAAEGGGLAEEKHRVLLWNPPTLIFPELFTWAEDTFGATMVMDMLTFNRHPFIDTSSEESMLRDLARIIMDGPMAQHTRGPVEYFFDDMFFLVDHFSIDIIWMAAHLVCKNTQALLGMMREKCRRRDIPLLIIDYDLSDSRVVSVDEMKSQVTTFMQTVMAA
jgi:benzoyl-CoA reductase/2-hydroxyglutaryl-CoA dehydratase subunit BcrC/BadD/HgdB